MQTSDSMVQLRELRQLGADDWRDLRDVRLRALQESPHTFLSSHERERVYDEQQWRTEFDRGEWFIGLAEEPPGQHPISLVGLTCEVIAHFSDTNEEPKSRYFIEYMWVEPGCRGHGIGFKMLDRILDRQYKRGTHRIYLWVLNGNTPAIRLYENMGFRSTKLENLLPEKPGRSEHQYVIDLSKDDARRSMRDRHTSS